MKHSYADINKRRESILEHLLLTKKNMAEVKELATIFNVSPMTIRRDLQVLEKMGKIQRYYGGATLQKATKNEGNTHNSSIEFIKREIAKKASSYVKEGMTLFINSSSTALTSMEFLNDKNITLISNNLKIRNKHIDSRTNIILLGGEIRYPKEALVGDICTSNLSNMYSNISLLGCSGISASGGLTTNNIHESKINKVMIENTRDFVIVAADYRKIGHKSSFKVTDCTQIDILITDTYADQKTISNLELLGIEVIQIII